MLKNLFERTINKTISPDQFEKEIRALSVGIARDVKVYYGSKLDPIRLFRSRVFKSETLPTLLCEYSYPPIDSCNMGRANENKSPIFYASAGSPTTFVESRCKVGDIIVISEYRGKSELLVQEVGFSNSRNGNTDYERLMHEIFVHPTNDYYEYSSKIAKHLMGGELIHGITYPSIISNNQNQNVALKPQYVDKFLSLINCTAFKIKDISNSYEYDVDEINFGVNDNGVVNWTGRAKQWTIRETGDQLVMRSNGWDWEAYDRNNKLVDPE